MAAFGGIMGADGRRQYGGGSDMGKVSAGKGISPGRSQAQFGHSGHAGKTEDQAKSDQRLGNDTPPGSDPYAGHNTAESKGFQRQQQVNAQAAKDRKSS
jgi:hypothetical protein